MMIPCALSLADSRATLETVGGKGAALARLAAAGLPLPDGFHITTAAYRRFVAEITTPARTPLFVMAAGIVTDVGRPLSHGSIVAHENGIPAVPGTGVATQRIQTGQTITVDGTAGLVTLAEGQ